MSGRLVVFPVRQGYSNVLASVARINVPDLMWNNVTVIYSGTDERKFI